VKVADKSPEITAIPELLRRLGLRGGVVTIEAAGPQTALATTIRAGPADDVLAQNQAGLAEAVQALFEWAHRINFADLQHDPCRHWVLGVGMNADACRLRQDPIAKMGLKGKRLRTGCEETALCAVLANTK
jgi:predicted transposase YbfD/YdcC